MMTLVLSLRWITYIWAVLSIIIGTVWAFQEDEDWFIGIGIILAVIGFFFLVIFGLGWLLKIFSFVW